ncbi:hypothetical protein [Streptomyces sviceus]|uniref:hypothetical protein n=1 Tax=Streptomyces sviceus TaxID=285530 RepID=UPI0036B0DFCB
MAARNPEAGGTPTAVINHVRIPADHNGLLFDVPLFSNLLRQIRNAPGERGAYVFPEVTGTPGLS